MVLDFGLKLVYQTFDNWVLDLSGRVAADKELVFHVNVIFGLVYELYVRIHDGAFCLVR